MLKRILENINRQPSCWEAIEQFAQEMDEKEESKENI